MDTDEHGRERGSVSTPVLFFLLPILCIACAKRGFPTGGPLDETGPEVVRTVPVSGATGVPADAEIRIRFSEPMERRTVESAVFISPNPSEALRFRWHGDEVTVLLPERLRPDRTCVVTVGAGARDRHRNALADSYTFAFATGLRMDRGEIWGRVAGLRPEGVNVWAYDPRGGEDPDPARATPEYVIQAGEDGTYRFRYLSQGVYRLFAFQDRNRDGEYTLGKDPLAVPSGDVVLSDSAESVRAGDFHLALRDTTGPSLLSARASDNAHVLLRFNEPIRADTAKIEIRLSASPVDLIERYRDPSDPAKIHLLTDEQTPGATYRATVAGVTDSSGNAISEEGGGASFSGSSVPDTVRPKIASLAPSMDEEDVRMDRRLEIVFDEAMWAAGFDSTFWIASDSTQTPPGAFRWEDPITLTFSPGEGWEEGVSYMLQGCGAALSDRAGNALEGDVVLRFSVLERRTFGAISGMIVDNTGTPGGPSRLIARPTEGKGRAARLTVQGDGPYVWPDLLPGRYLLSAFRDDDEDGKLGYGRTFPFVPSEPTAARADTVTVRSRWETEGIDLEVR